MTWRKNAGGRLAGARSGALLALFLVGPGGSAVRDGKNRASQVPRRIVAMAPNTAEVICALGACDDIVGVSKFCVHPPQLKSRPQIGGLSDPDLERIITLRPDLVVTRGQHDAIERLCARLGTPIHHDETDSLKGIEKAVLELGARLGREAQAEAVNSGFRARLEAIRERVRGRERPRVLITISRHPDRLANILTTGRGTFLDELIDVAGGVNVFGDLDMRYPEVSVESIVARRPDFIFEFMPEWETRAQESEILRSWNALETVPAVNSRRIFIVSDENALIPSPRYVDVIDKVSRILHPTERDR